MSTAPNADKAWKTMARSLADPTDSDRPTATGRAGAAACRTLLEGHAARAADDSTAEPWLLLRERTAGRLRHV
ncbi:hypothetical protein ACFYY3_19230 [Streptomyces sp. NPDC001812]|uniref:hypothetical protein n=1 Tax=Streptomyces sp. NPDC001812 TaxID=3364611 RepID=UPI00367A75D1